MTAFLADPLWNRPAKSYTIAAMADAAMQIAVAPVMAEIAKQAEGATKLYLPPPARLHVSLYSMAPVRSSFDKAVFWQGIRTQTFAELQRWCAAHPPPLLHFSSLHATDTAVIAIAEPVEAVWDLRRQMAAALPEPPGGAARYDMIHMTLARYAQPQHLPADFAARIAALPVALDFHVGEVIVMHETVYPSLAFDVIDRFALAASDATSRKS